VSQLSESTIEELKSALAEQLKHAHSPSSELTTALRKAGAEAREKKIKPEELLVLFKQIWNSLAESVRPPSSELQERMRQNLVTLCIQAYYAE
jgi:flagellar biosynthesis regulator FlaF